MAWPGTLTAEEQEIVQVFVDQLYRGTMVNLVRALNNCDAAKDEWTNRVSDLFTGLVDADEIPNGSNLAGSEALRKDEIVAALTSLSSLLATYNTEAKRAAYAQAAGTVNMIQY